MAAANNMLAAEGEIGAGRDITQIVPGGFSSAGALNGNLRARAAATFLDGALGSVANTPINTTSTPHTDAYDTYSPTDAQPFYTIEKRVGTTGTQLLTLQYTDCMINTLSIAANAGALSTFSAGVMTAGENYISSPIVDDTLTGQPFSYTPTTNDLLVFHGGRIQVADVGSSLVENDQFQSLEIAINNNIQGDEYTIRPSRFLHSFTEGIRDVEANMTLVFNDYHQYQQYTYGATGRTTPGYSLYTGQLDFILANWQIASADLFNLAGGLSTVPAAGAQAIHFYLPSVVFAGFPVTLTTGRIVVTTNGRAVKPVGSSTPIVTCDVRPGGAGF